MEQDYGGSRQNHRASESRCLFLFFFFSVFDMASVWATKVVPFSYALHIEGTPTVDAIHFAPAFRNPCLMKFPCIYQPAKTSQGLKVVRTDFVHGITPLQSSTEKSWGSESRHLRDSCVEALRQMIQGSLSHLLPPLGVPGKQLGKRV